MLGEVHRAWDSTKQASVAGPGREAGQEAPGRAASGEAGLW